MKRDWKPGDVAILTYKSADAGDGEHVAMYASATCRICFSGQASQRGHWHTLGGMLNDADSYNPRPLVVIDPDGRRSLRPARTVQASRATGPGCGG